MTSSDMVGGVWHDLGNGGRDPVASSASTNSERQLLSFLIGAFHGVVWCPAFFCGGRSEVPALGTYGN